MILLITSPNGFASASFDDSKFFFDENLIIQVVKLLLHCFYIFIEHNLNFTVGKLEMDWANQTNKLEM